MELDGFTILATGLDHPEGAAWGPDGARLRRRRGRADLPDRARRVDGARSATPAGSCSAWRSTAPGQRLRLRHGSRRDRARVAGRRGRRPTRAAPRSIRSACRTSRRSTTPASCTSPTRASGARTTGSCSASQPGGETTRVDRCGAGVPERVLPDRGGRRAAGGRVARAPRGAGARSSETGAAGPVTVAADLTGSQPDGIALAADGTMFVGCYRPDRVWRIAPGGDAGDLGRGRRRRDPEPAREPGVRRAGAGPAAGHQPRRVEPRDGRPRRRGPAAALPDALTGRRQTDLGAEPAERARRQGDVATVCARDLPHDREARGPCRRSRDPAPRRVERTARRPGRARARGCPGRRRRR